jgi:hypothetical protein
VNIEKVTGYICGLSVIGFISAKGLWLARVLAKELLFDDLFADTLGILVLCDKDSDAFAF